MQNIHKKIMKISMIFLLLINQFSHCINSNNKKRNAIFSNNCRIQSGSSQIQRSANDHVTEGRKAECIKYNYSVGSEINMQNIENISNLHGQELASVQNDKNSSIAPPKYRNINTNENIISDSSNLISNSNKSYFAERNVYEFPPATFSYNSRPQHQTSNTLKPFIPYYYSNITYPLVQPQNEYNYPVLYNLHRFDEVNNHIHENLTVNRNIQANTLASSYNQGQGSNNQYNYNVNGNHRVDHISHLTNNQQMKNFYTQRFFPYAHVYNSGSANIPLNKVSVDPSYYQELHNRLNQDFLLRSMHHSDFRQIQEASDVRRIPARPNETQTLGQYSRSLQQHNINSNIQNSTNELNVQNTVNTCPRNLNQSNYEIAYADENILNKSIKQSISINKDNNLAPDTVMVSDNSNSTVIDLRNSYNAERVKNTKKTDSYDKKNNEHDKPYSMKMRSQNKFQKDRSEFSQIQIKHLNMINYQKNEKEDDLLNQNSINDKKQWDSRIEEIWLALTNREDLILDMTLFGIKNFYGKDIHKNLELILKIEKTYENDDKNCKEMHKEEKNDSNNTEADIKIKIKYIMNFIKRNIKLENEINLLDIKIKFIEANFNVESYSANRATIDFTYNLINLHAHIFVKKTFYTINDTIKIYHIVISLLSDDNKNFYNEKYSKNLKRNLLDTILFLYLYSCLGYIRTVLHKYTDKRKKFKEKNFSESNAKFITILNLFSYHENLEKYEINEISFCSLEMIYKSLINVSKTINERSKELLNFVLVTEYDYRKETSKICLLVVDILWNILIKKRCLTDKYMCVNHVDIKNTIECILQNEVFHFFRKQFITLKNRKRDCQIVRSKNKNFDNFDLYFDARDLVFMQINDDKSCKNELKYTYIIIRYHFVNNLCNLHMNNLLNCFTRILY